MQEDMDGGQENAAEASDTDAWGETGAKGGSDADTGANTGADWVTVLPEALQESGRALGNMEDLSAALKRGMDYKPIVHAEDVKIVEDKGGLFQDSTLGWFKAVAAETGMTQGMVNKIVAGFNAEMEQGQKIMVEESTSYMKETYGDKWKEVLGRANDVCRLFNGTTDGALDRLYENGLNNNKDFIRLMVAVSELVSESSIPGNPAGSGADAAMSTEEYIKNVFR